MEQQGQAPGQNEIKENFMLFYSNRCGQSQKFIELLQEFPHINSCFQKLEVEMLYKMGRLPPQLTHTPGVVDGNQLVMGPDAFEWLKKKSKELVQSQSFNSKGGLTSESMAFSFIGDAENDFNHGHANFGREDINNGSSINPDNFDSKSGQPLNSNNQQGNSGMSNLTYNPNDLGNNNSQKRELPQQLQSQKIGTGGDNFGLNSPQHTPNNNLPAGLQSTNVEKGSNKLTDSDMQRYLSSRDQGIQIPR